MKPFSLEEYIKNPSRKVVTRDGREVKIHCTNYYLGNQCVIAEIEDIGRSFSFNQYGQPYGYVEENPLDLFFLPEKKEGYVNILKVDNCCYLGSSTIFNSEEEAGEAGKSYLNYATTAKIEWEE